MQDTNVTSPRLSALDRLKIAMKESREYFRKIKHLAYNIRGDSGDIGRIPKFLARAKDRVAGFFSGGNTWTTLALSTAFENSSFNLLDAVKSLALFSRPTSEPTPRSVTDELAQSFDDVAFANVVVTRAVAAKLAVQEAAFEAQLQKDVANAFEKVSERVSQGQYVGIDGLVAELNEIQANVEDAHQLKATFDEKGSVTFAHCEEKVAGMMKAEFTAANDAPDAVEPSERILTFRDSADPAPAKLPSITSYMPTIPGMLATQQEVPIPVLAATPPRPHFGPRGI